MRRQLSSHFCPGKVHPCTYCSVHVISFLPRHPAGTYPLECLFHRYVGAPWVLGHSMSPVSDAPWHVGGVPLLPVLDWNHSEGSIVIFSITSMMPSMPPSTSSCNLCTIWMLDACWPDIKNPCAYGLGHLVTLTRYHLGRRCLVKEYKCGLEGLLWFVWAMDLLDGPDCLKQRNGQVKRLVLRSGLILARADLGSGLQSFWVLSLVTPSSMMHPLIFSLMKPLPSSLLFSGHPPSVLYLLNLQFTPTPILQYFQFSPSLRSLQCHFHVCCVNMDQSWHWSLCFLYSR